VTRFILICNYVTRIIEPLASRCAKFRFQALPVDSMKERLTEICINENCTDHEISLIDDVLQYAEGDMRRAVTTMQSVHAIIAGSSSNSQVAPPIVTSSIVAEIAGVPPSEVVNELWDCCSKQSSYDAMHRGVENVIASGFSAQLLLSALLSCILLPPNNDAELDAGPLDELSQAMIAIRIAEAEKNMIDGADEYLQLMTVCSLIFTCFVKLSTSARQ
jgi:replication factor C subunit 2/4